MVRVFPDWDAAKDGLKPDVPLRFTGVLYRSALSPEAALRREVSLSAQLTDDQGKSRLMDSAAITYELHQIREAHRPGGILGYLTAALGNPVAAREAVLVRAFEAITTAERDIFDGKRKVGDFPLQSPSLASHIPEARPTPRPGRFPGGP